MDLKANVIEKLSKIPKDKIFFSSHALIRLKQRQITKEEVIRNLLNPEKLEYVKKEYTNCKSEEKYDCYFVYSKNLFHRYVLVFFIDVLVVTVIKVNRRWQRIFKKGMRLE